MNRTELIEEYVSRILDGMSLKDLELIAFETLCDRLDDYTETDLINEISNYYPDLVEGYRENV